MKESKIILNLILGFVATFVLYSALPQPLMCEMPDIRNMTKKKAKETLAENGLVLGMSKTGYSDTVKKGCVLSQEHEPGKSVRRGSEVNVVISGGALVKVPDLKNVSKKEAKAKLQKLGLKLEVKEESYSNKIEKGAVISQKPAAGSKVKKGSKVQVVLSKGIEKKKVPNLVGLTEQEAKKKLKKQQLKCKSKTSYNAYIAKGKVISQSIEDGEKVKKGSTVTIVVSKGKKPIPKPTSDSKPSPSPTPTSDSKPSPSPAPTSTPKRTINPTPTLKPILPEVLEYDIKH